MHLSGTTSYGFTGLTYFYKYRHGYSMGIYGYAKHPKYQRMGRIVNNSGFSKDSSSVADSFYKYGMAATWILFSFRSKYKQSLGS